MDDLVGTALHTAIQYHQLVARNDSSSNSTANPNDPSAIVKPGYYKIIGLVLAIASGLFIGVSFVLKKTGLLQANAKYNEEAGEGYGYLKNAWWWGGMTLMILGEICNFAAYLFADAILVTPLGALSVVVCAILSSIFLKERLSFVGKIGCFSCIVGAVVIAANAPSQGAVASIQQMKTLVLAPGFLVYAGIVIVGCFVVAMWVAPKYGKKSMMVYITVCSFIGGLSVVMIQGIGAAITAQARGIPQFNQWFLYLLLVFVIVTLVTEIIYLNKALNLYNAALVTPTYYVYFTSCTIISSAVLFQGFKGTAIEILTVVLGFLQICSGVVLLQLSKSAKDVPDAAVFSGDLDQVRTVAEQEEPEYEPRADTMRGTAALIRAISTKRQRRETMEAARIREEHMEPIGENDSVEWDGLRRRRTITGPDSPRLQRRKTIHPPLGMSTFPGSEEEEVVEEEDGGMHPGFWSHFRRKPVHSSSSQLDADASSMALPMGPLSGRPRPDSAISDFALPQGSNLGLPSTLRNIADSPTIPEEEDSSYKGAGSSRTGSPAVRWAGSVSAPHLSPPGTGSSQTSPSARAAGQAESPRASARRQFSFHSVFNRNRADTAGSQSSGGGGNNHGGVQESPNPNLTHYPYISSEALQHAAAAGNNNNANPLGASTRPLTQRSGLSFARRASGQRDSNAGTEEERLGLVRSGTRELASGGSEDLPGYDSQESSNGSQKSRGDMPPPGYDGANTRRKDGDAGGGAGAGATGAKSPGEKDLEAGGGTSGRAFV